MGKLILPGGVAESWSSIRCAIGGVPAFAITEIEVSETQVKTNEYGAGTDPMFRGYGNKEYSAKLTMFSNLINEIQKGVSSNSLLDIPTFDIVLVIATINGGVPRTITIKGCDFLENVFSVKQGDTKVLQTVPIIVGGVIFS